MQDGLSLWVLDFFLLFFFFSVVLGYATLAFPSRPFVTVFFSLLRSGFPQMILTIIVPL